MTAGLALGEKLGASGRDLLTAFIIGFEVECKIAESIHADADHYRGGPRNPLSREGLADKFYDCIQEVLPPPRATKLLETLESLEQLEDIRSLAEMAAVP